MEFKDRLMNLRKRKGWSQEELGFQVEVSRQTVSKWESGDTTPEMAKLIQLSRIFDVSLDTLAKGEEFPAPESHGRLGTASSRFETYEYKSERTFLGLPLVHVVKGPGPCRAKGIIAVGKSAVGVVAVGFASVGIFSLGLVSVGLFSLALLSVGLLSLGSIAVGGAGALGAVAVGNLAIGAVAVGDYAVGAAAIGDKIAIGDFARGTLAFGNEAQGSYIYPFADGLAPLTRARFVEEVVTHLPDANKSVVKLLSYVFPG